jgi:ketosteroid isomerase-like protein
MSQENVEIVRAAWGEAGNDLQVAAAKYWDPDIEYVEDPQWPGASTYHGRDAVLACFGEYERTLAPDGGWTVTVDKVVDAGDRQVAIIRSSSRSASGVPHEHHWGYVVQVTNGRLVYVRAYYDAAEALEAVGLRE